MRFEQIIAAVTRSLNITGVREITRVDAFAHAASLQLCMACASPGKPMYSGLMYSGPTYWLFSGHPNHDQLSHGNPSHQRSHAWLATAAKSAPGKQKRLPLTARLLGMAKRGMASLPTRDC